VSKTALSQIERAKQHTSSLPMFAVILSVLATGCSSTGGRNAPRFEVDLGFQDYASLTYFELSESASEENPRLRRIELSGSGHLQYAMGRSSRVSEGFWAQSDEKYWRDLYTDQVVIGGGETRAFLQALVNAGVFERKLQGRHVEKPGNDYVFVHARINGRDGVLMSDAPAFLKIYKDLEACLRQ
jgi:hypothetical protein